MSGQREILLNMIDMYKDMPFLWNKNHPDYNKSSARKEGYEVLFNMYKKIDPEYTIQLMKKKIENMRTFYLREARKVIASKHMGEIYVPTLWYYDAFSFLESTIEPCEYAQDSLKNENLSSSDEERSRAGSTGEYSIPAKKKKTILHQHEHLLYPIETLTVQDEECEMLGKLIGLQLRDLDKTQFIIAQKLISDVIYYARIGRLSEDANITLGT